MIDIYIYIYIYVYIYIYYESYGRTALLRCLLTTIVCLVNKLLHRAMSYIYIYIYIYIVLSEHDWYADVNPSTTLAQFCAGAKKLARVLIKFLTKI